MATYTDDQVETFISTRAAALRKQGEQPRNCREIAAMEWDAHTGRIAKRDLPKDWKDPYTALEKAAKAKAKPKTAKAKAKK